MREIPEEGVAGERRVREVLPDGARADAGEAGGQGDPAPGAEGQGVAGEGDAGERDPQVRRSSLRSLEHRNIVQLRDTFEWEGEYFMIMELCQNNSLKGKPSAI